MNVFNHHANIFYKKYYPLIKLFDEKRMFLVYEQNIIRINKLKLAQNNAMSNEILSKLLQDFVCNITSYKNFLSIFTDKLCSLNFYKVDNEKFPFFDESLMLTYKLHCKSSQILSTHNKLNAYRKNVNLIFKNSFFEQNNKQYKSFYITIY